MPNRCETPGRRQRARSGRERVVGSLPDSRVSADSKGTQDRDIPWASPEEGLRREEPLFKEVKASIVVESSVLKPDRNRRDVRVFVKPIDAEDVVKVLSEKPCLAWMDGISIVDDQNVLAYVV